MPGMVSWSTGLGKINVEKERERQTERQTDRERVRTSILGCLVLGFLRGERLEVLLLTFFVDLLALRNIAGKTCTEGIVR